MSLASEYARQAAWRTWAPVFEALPPVRDRLVVDLGCGVGAQAAELVARGARVIGIDADPELLDAARRRRLERADFRQGDLRDLGDLGVAADGLWCSFTAAYFPDLPRALEAWSALLRPGGWIALTEADDLFGHEPLSPRAKAVLAAYASEALAAGRYDFCMGRKLRAALEQCGFAVTTELTLPDQELSFDGPAPPEVSEAWGRRLDRLAGLRQLAGADFDAVRADVLACLGAAEHRASCRVRCCIAAA